MATTEISASSTLVTTKEVGRIVRKKKFQKYVSLAIHNDQVEGSVSVPVLIDRGSSCLPWCCLGAWIEVEGQRDASNTEGQQHLKASKVTLIRCAPDPNAVAVCLHLVAQKELPLSIFSKTHLENLDQISTLLEANRENQRKEIAQLVRQLNGLEAKRVACQRKPHTRQRHLRVLEQVASSVPLMNIRTEAWEGSHKSQITSNIPEERAQIESELLPVNLPKDFHHNNASDDNNTSASRLEYLREKKWPQIQWILQRLSQIGGEFRHVLDVGGGRGDLATAIASQFPNAHVTVVDQNKPSLEAGMAYAKELGLSVSSNELDMDGQMTFHCANFATFVQSYSSNKEGNNNKLSIDVVVALHACGDLSDLALQFAHQIQATFVICPCCYTKRYIDEYKPMWMQHFLKGVYCQPVVTRNKEDTAIDVEEEGNGDITNRSDSIEADAKKTYNPSPDERIMVVQRLAELNENPEVSHQAMRVINTLRLQALLEEDSFCGSPISRGLEEYPSAISMRNIVLVGSKIAG